MKDGFGREISYMRVSITEKCNLRCIYCAGCAEQPGCAADPGTEGRHFPESSGAEMNPDRHFPESSGAELSPAELEEIVEAAVSLGIRKIRITGGEPLVRPEVLEICERIHGIPGVEELTLTTNGVLFQQYADKLKKAGVSRVNISLDTLRRDRYHAVTGGDIQAVFRGIRAAWEAGLVPVKINVVLMKGVNEDEIDSFVELARTEPVEVRFIELMPMTGGNSWEVQHFLSGEEVLAKAPGLIPIEAGSHRACDVIKGSVARLYRSPGGVGRVGLISPVSSHFCPSCNRIRLTSDGHIRSCLYFEEEIDIYHLHGVELREALKRAILTKPMEHENLRQGKVGGSGRSMNRIGG